MTIVHPGYGAWQSTDFRLTKRRKPVDDAATKQLRILWHGNASAILAFTGLAAIHPRVAKKWAGGDNKYDDGMPMMEYIRRTLRGENRSLDGYMRHLCDRLNRDVTNSDWRRESLCIHVAHIGPAVAKREGPGSANRVGYLFQVTNQRAPVPTPEQPNGEFRLARFVETEAFWMANGSGAEALGEEEQVKLNRAVRQKPRTSADYHKLLGSINRKISNRTHTVSPWSQSAFMSPDGEDRTTMVHRKHGDPPISVNSVLPTLIMGIDSRELSGSMVKWMEDGVGLSDEEWSRRAKWDGTSGPESVNPLP